MTLGFLLFTLGAALIYTSLQNMTLADILLGRPGPGQPPDIVSNDTSGGSAGGGGVSGTVGGLIGGGMTVVDGKRVCRWVGNELERARKNGWDGQVTSGYRSKAHQKRVCDTGVKPCAAPGESRHQGRKFPNCAVDVTNPEGLDAALPIGSPLVWAGSADPPHFSSGALGGSGY